MKELKLITHPDEFLRKKVKEVPHGEDIKDVISQMKIIRRDNNGVGLAANQVGYDGRVFITKLGDTGMTFINPKVIKRFGKRTVLEEGCLSIPGATIPVKRPESVLVEWDSPDWKKRRRRVFNGMMAKIIQHEYDHLDGILITDKQ